MSLLFGYSKDIEEDINMNGYKITDLPSPRNLLRKVMRTRIIQAVEEAVDYPTRDLRCKVILI